MSEFHAKIEQVLEDHVRPVLAMHRGNIGIVNANADTGVVELKFMGSCSGCPITSITFYQIVERALMEEVPEVEMVIDVDNPIDE